MILLAEIWSKIYTECSNCYKNNEHNNTCNQDIQCTLPVITIMALWQLMNLGTWYTVTQCWYSRTKECSNYYKSNEHNIIGGNMIQDIHRTLELLQEHEQNNTSNQIIQCALPVITIMALWQLMNLGTWCTVTQCWYSRTTECSNYYKSNEHNIIGGNVIQDIHRVLELLQEQWA